MPRWPAGYASGMSDWSSRMRRSTYIASSIALVSPIWWVLMLTLTIWSWSPARMRRARRPGPPRSSSVTCDAPERRCSARGGRVIPAIAAGLCHALTRPLAIGSVDGTFVHGPAEECTEKPTENTLASKFSRRSQFRPSRGKQECRWRHHDRYRSVFLDSLCRVLGVPKRANPASEMWF